MNQASLAAREKNLLKHIKRGNTDDNAPDVSWLEEEIQLIIREMSGDSFEAIEKYKLDTNKIEEQLERRKLLAR